MNIMVNKLETIQGVSIKELSKIKNDKGNILHVLKSSDSCFTQFGECYISEVFPEKVKAWKKNAVQTQNLAVIEGRIKFVIFDDREGSISKGILNVFEISRAENYKLLTIPPNIWYGFGCLGSQKSIIVNCSDHPHSIKNIKSMDIQNDLIPFNW